MNGERRKRVLLLTDEQLDRILAWYEDSHPRGDIDLDEEDEDIVEKVRAVRLS